MGTPSSHERVAPQKSDIKILEKLLKSRPFRNTDTYKNLLRYLFEASLQEKSPKEAQIAADILHKGNDFDPAIDTSVRVYIHNLRTKLDEYYQNEGKSDPVRLLVPKGRYTVTVSRICDTPASRKKLHTILHIVTGAIILLFGVYIASIHIKQSRVREYWDTVDTDAFIWKDMFDSDLPVNLVFGEPYFYMERLRTPDLFRLRFVRDININKESEFEAYQEQNKNSRYEILPSNVQYVQYTDAHALPYLLKIFFANQKLYEMNELSLVSPPDLYQKNMILMTNYSYIPDLHHYFDYSHFSIQRGNSSTISVTRSLSDTSEIYGMSEKFELQYNDIYQGYSIISKFKGPGNNDVVLLLSFKTIGLMQAIRTITVPELLGGLEKKFIDEYGAVPASFEVLISTKGYVNETLESEIVAALPVDIPKIFWEIYFEKVTK